MREGLKRGRGPGLLLPALLLVGIPLLVLGGAAHASEALFGEHCAACHGADAQGTPGLAPPLAYPALWQGLGEQAPDYLVGVVSQGLSGPLTSRGQVYQGLVMPPQSQLSAPEVASLATYLLKLGGLEREVSAAEVEQARGLSLSRRQLLGLRPSGL